MKTYTHSIIFSIIMGSIFLTTSCNKLNPNAPQACFVIPDEIIAGSPTIFSSICSVNAISYAWSFGDGDVSTEASPTHTYSDGGAFTVTLTVANAAGKTDEASQHITVAAPAFIEHTGTLESDETWVEGLHIVTGDIYVDGATLMFEPGATVMFKAGAGMYVGYHSGFSGAALIANGTAEKPITFTSAATSPSPGDWDYIGFYQGASNLSSMLHCVVEYGGGYSANYGEIYVEGSSVTIENSTLRNSQTYGVNLATDGSFASFTGNTVMDNGSSAIKIYGNYAHTIGEGNTITSEKGVLVEGDDIEQADATWLKLSTHYILNGSFYLESTTGAKLTINPGADIRLGQDARFHVAYRNGKFGTLIAEGTEGDHIKFTSSAPVGTESPGDWDYIAFYEGAGNSSSFAYCDISYGGGYSATYGMIHVEGSSVSISHSTIKNSQYSGVNLRTDGSFDSFSDNVFEGNATVPIEIYANYAHTIGSGNSFNTGPGIIVKGDDIDQADATWLMQDVPYIVDGSIFVESTTGARLTIEAGTTVKFTTNSEMYVGYRQGNFGILIADGDPANKITFTSGAPAGFESAGDWDGLWFYDGSGNGTILDNCIISYGGGYSANSGNVNVKNGIGAGVPIISSCEISNSASYGIYLDNAVSPTLTANTFTSNASGDMN